MSDIPICKLHQSHGTVQRFKDTLFGSAALLLGSGCEVTRLNFGSASPEFAQVAHLFPSSLMLSLLFGPLLS